MPVVTLTPEAAWSRVRAGERLIDIRGEAERLAGMADGAIGIAMNDLLATPAAHLGADPVLLICQKGMRSAQAAETLAALGYNVTSVEGGTEAWRAADMPMAHTSASGSDPYFGERYSRQVRLPEIDVAGQQKLAAAHVLVVGAGGLGAPALFYLAAAGVGRITLVDDDRVDRSNLQRQIVHTEHSVGSAKVESARERLSALNPHVVIETHDAKIDASNATRLLEGIDVAIDGSDNFAVRHVLNAACVEKRIPLVYGAVDRFTGQASVFNAGVRGEVPCYRCLFPDAPEGVLNCAEAGVLGVVPGLIGLVQATETLKLLLGIGTSLSGRLLHFDALGMRFRETRIPADPACPACGTHPVT